MKPKHQRQIEAIERKKKSVPAAISRLQAVVADAKRDPHDLYQQRLVASHEASLARLLREIGCSSAEADGTARAVAQGKPASTWSSGQPKHAPLPEPAKRPATIEAALQRLDKVVPAASAVLLMPHPALPAIQVRADAPTCDGSFIVDMSILEIDRLASACRNRGLRVFRNEAEYLEYQLATPVS